MLAGQVCDTHTCTQTHTVRLLVELLLTRNADNSWLPPFCSLARLPHVCCCTCLCKQEIYTCICLLACYHQLIMTPEFTFVHKFSAIFTTFSCGRFLRRSISCCTDANMISELNETQTHHFQEETKRFCVAPDGFLSELSSKNEGTGRRRSCASLVDLNHRLRRENVFLGFMFLTWDDAI